MTSYDNPMIDPKEIDDARLTLPEHIFKQEYLAEFVDGGSSVFGEINYSEEVKESKLFYGGLDVARADDYTVLTIFNDKGNMVFIDRWRHDSWTNIVAKAAKIIEQYNANVYVEVNSIGDPIFEMLKQILNNKNLVQPFVTTSKSKQDIIEQLAVANQNKEVTILPVEWLKKEFDVFTYEYNPKTRIIKYSAPSGFHDDGIMSSAIGYESFKKLKLKGKYFIV
jgi:ribosomal protein L13E